MTSVPKPYTSNNPGSFAFVTIKDRLPSILRKAINCFDKTWSLYLSSKLSVVPSEDKTPFRTEANDIINKLNKLHQELTTNQELTLFPEDSEELQLWNQQLIEIRQSNYDSLTWFEGPWLYVECYMYRRIRYVFEKTQYFTGFDPFEIQKREALKNSLKTAEALAKHVIMSDNKDDIQTFLEMALWGNKCDLSLSGGDQTPENQSKVQDLAPLREKILSNSLPQLVELMNSLTSKASPATVDIVLDNAGFELFTDLCLTDILTRFLPEGSIIRFYVKTIPWFISDAMTKDIHWLLRFLSQSTEFPVLVNLSTQWLSNLQSGKWVLIADDYWTLGYDYSCMQAVKPSLYKKLSEADVLIFKGDLNYRKLTGDLMWERTTSFKDALRGFLPTNLASMRIIKADVVVGLASDAVHLGLPDNWFYSGEYALVHLVSV